MLKNWTALVLCGVLSIVGGLLALFNPFEATVTAVILAAWLFIFLGSFQLYYSWHNLDKSHRIWSIISGLIGVCLGGLLFANPAAGAYSLTLALAIVLLISGINKILVAVPLNGNKSFWPIIISGIFSIFFAGWLWFDLNELAGSILGYLLSFELLMNGYVILFIGFNHKKQV